MIKSIISYILIGIGLSIDAFFSCLAIGCNKRRNVQAVLFTPFIIGAFHIIFPLTAYFLTRAIVNLPQSAKIAAFGSYIAGGIFIVMGFFNILHREKAVKAFIVSIIDITLLSFSVSIDSIMVGLSLGFSGTYNIILGAAIFGLIAGGMAFLSIKTARCYLKGVEHAEIYSGIFFIILGILSLLQIL
ncbi:MAG: manganese efflux pump [Bacilli bacterium]|jgi:putative Mn2+ efflux pump MntP|nr:manganese efflux pump [Bacilli bacterium]